MRIHSITAAAFAAAALTAGCDEAEDAADASPDRGDVIGGAAGAGGGAAGDAERSSEAVGDLGANPAPPEGVARDPEATPGEAGPNRPEGVDRAGRQGDGARTGAAEMEADGPEGLSVEPRADAAESPQEKTRGRDWPDDS